MLFPLGPARAQSPPIISAAFSPSTVPVGVTTTLTFTITNPNASTALAGVSFTDVLPAGLSAFSTNFTNTCGGTPTLDISTGTISLSGGSIPAGSTCTVTDNMAALTAAGTYTDTSGAVTSTNGGTGNAATATLIVQPVNPPTISGAFAPSTILVNGVSTLTFTITNPNNLIGAFGLSFTDVLPSGLVVSTPSGLSSTCAGTATATAGTGTISLAGGFINAPNASCTVTVNVTSSTASTYTNTSGAVSSTDDGTGNSATATLTVLALQAPTIAKAFGAGSIPLNGTTSLSFTIGNPNTLLTLTGVGFTDPLPAGLVVSTPNGLSGSCGGGSITAAAGGSSVILSGASLAASGVCTFSVNVTGTSTGTKNNTTGNVTSNEAGAGLTASATLGVNAPATTATTLISSQNPSSFRQPVTFTATVSSGAGTPTGTITFSDGGTVIGTATLAGGTASFTTSTLTVGTHTITAAYGGTVGFAPNASAPLLQSVQVPTDSVRLRSLQLEVTKLEAQGSGDAFAGAVAGAIADGFDQGGGAFITPSGNGLRFNFAAEPNAGGQRGAPADPYDSVLDARTRALRDNGLAAPNQNLPASLRGFAGEPTAASRIDDAFTGLAYTQPMVTKAPLAPRAGPREWLMWGEVRGTGWNTDPSAGDIRGGQVNALVGLTRRVTPDFLLGALGGYENFNYTSQTLNGRLKGDGWTFGGYVGWRPWTGVRFDAAVGRSGVSYNGESGLAAASFPGERWLASAGLTGTYRTPWRLEIEPSARVYAIWEHDSPYVDSLGTAQADDNFSTGRASAGAKATYPIVWSPGTVVAPYVGLYADYYFSSDNAALLLPTQFVHGWAARTIAGLSYCLAGGAKISVGGEVGGLGSQNFTNWTGRVRASLPF